MRRHIAYHQSVTEWVHDCCAAATKGHGWNVTSWLPSVHVGCKAWLKTVITAGRQTKCSSVSSKGRGRRHLEEINVWKCLALSKMCPSKSIQYTHTPVRGRKHDGFHVFGYAEHKKFSASAIFHSANVVLSLSYRPFHQQSSPDSSGGNDQLWGEMQQKCVHNNQTDKWLPGARNRSFEVGRGMSERQKNSRKLRGVCEMEQDFRFLLNKCFHL